MGEDKNYQASNSHSPPCRSFIILAFKPWIVCPSVIWTLRDVDVQNLFVPNVLKNWATQNKKSYTARCPPGHWKCVANFRTTGTKSTLQGEFKVPVAIWSCSNVVNTTFIVHCELNLLSNVEAILEQRCNSDVTKSTSLQHFVLVVQHCDLITTLSERFVLAGLFNKNLWKAVNNYYYLMMKQFGKKGKKTNFCYSLCHFTQLYLLKAKMHLHFKMTFFEDERKNDSVYVKKCHFSIIIF